MVGHPKFLSKAARMTNVEPGRTLSARMMKLRAAVDSRLMARAGPTQLSPCPDCNACGLHKRRCRFYLDRAAIQVQSNPHAAFHGRMARILEQTGAVAE